MNAAVLLYHIRTRYFVVKNILSNSNDLGIGSSLFHCKSMKPALHCASADRGIGVKANPNRAMSDSARSDSASAPRVCLLLYSCQTKKHKERRKWGKVARPRKHTVSGSAARLRARLRESGQHRFRDTCFIRAEPRGRKGLVKLHGFLFL